MGCRRPWITNLKCRRQLLPTVARIGHYTGVQRTFKGFYGTLEKSVSGNKHWTLVVFLRFSSKSELQSHRLHQLSTIAKTAWGTKGQQSSRPLNLAAGWQSQQPLEKF